MTIKFPEVRIQPQQLCYTSMCHWNTAPPGMTYIYNVGFPSGITFFCPITRRVHAQTVLLRTIPDPEFPGEEDEKLFFVMVELNMDDIRELRRVTQIEMQGSLDADGVKAFVEVPRLVLFQVLNLQSSCTSFNRCSKESNYNYRTPLPQLIFAVAHPNLWMSKGV